MSFKALFILFCFALACAAKTEKNGGGVEFEVGGKKDDSNIKNLFNSINTPTKVTPDDSESGDGSGEVSDNDNEIYSGSGSGDDEDEKIVPVLNIKSTQIPKKSTASKVTKSVPRKSSVMVITEVLTTDKPSTKSTSESGNNEIDHTKPTSDPNNQAIKEAEEEIDEKSGVGFTIGIIIGVVVGAILAILVIVFLVYRLRKKDEGSYSLDEPSSQAFIRDEKNAGGQGKEYFA